MLKEQRSIAHLGFCYCFDALYLRYMKIPAQIPMTNPPTDLLQCLRASIPPYSAAYPSYPLIIEPDADGELWSSSTKPYNTRLEGSLEPLAVVYGKPERLEEAETKPKLPKPSLQLYVALNELEFRQ